MGVGIASFATVPMPPEPKGAYQNIGLLLKIAGWVRLIQMVLVGIVGGLIVAVVAFAGVGGWFATTLLGPFGFLGGLAAGLIIAVVLIAFLFAFAVALAFTWWTSWVYARWVAKDPGAVQSVFIYALVTTILSGLGVLAILLGNAPGIIELGLLVIGILLLVQSQDAQVKQLGTRPSAVPEDWKMVE